MSGVGELFLSAFIQVLIQQLATVATMAFDRRERVESFKKLSANFTMILAVLDDAEKKQLTEEPVKQWLGTLRDLAYDLEDILDEIVTKSLIEGSKEIEPQSYSMLCKCIPTCSRFTPGALVSNYKVMSKIKEITKRFECVVDQRSKLKLFIKSSVPYQQPSRRLPTTSLVNESRVYGRDEDKEAIISMLREAQEDVSVIPIVGMGGIGKTTLAQLVYNDREVKQNFHVKAWVCVSEDFDVLTVTKTICKEVLTGLNCDSMDLNLLQVSLQETLSKSKFLIVLDDVWNESDERWEAIYRPLEVGLPGSRIIVTTRNVTVASVVGSPRTAYHMKLLTDDDCLALLALHSRKKFPENSDLREVGQGLVRKCKGLPLAAKTLGGLLRSKDTKEEWVDVLKSKIWDLPEEYTILPVLRLSYYHLPLHLKPLFAYCSIFPKDYEFDKSELVLLWMAAGFLENPHAIKTKEQLGSEYFDELASRSFFQCLSGCESFVMHDLINDLAHFVVGETCYRLDEKMDTNQEYKLPGKARHASFLRHEFEAFRKFKAFLGVKGLRTFLPMPVQNSSVQPPFYLSNQILVELVPKLPSLRVLSLSGYSITELPSTICGLIHLRYLNLSGTSIVTLPDLSNLYRLETLSLRNCRFISNLPPTLGNLSNLRHLDISDTDQLRHLPVEICELKNLQTLPKIVLSKVGGLGLKELKNLKFLRGKLAVLELQNITDIEHVKEAHLKRKNELDELQLTWGNDNSESRNINSEEVLDLLEPQENLKNLKIEFYDGQRFPSWIGYPSFCKLSTLVIRGCVNCTSLPPLGQLPELKELHIREMLKIRSIGPEFYGNGTAVPFPKLEILRFNDMPEWAKWSFGADGDDPDTHILFPKLHQLAVLKCQRLTNVSPLNFPILHELDLEECNMVVLERLQNLDSLIYLKVEAIKGLSHIPRELMHFLAKLEVLECCNCDELLSLWPREISPNDLPRLRRFVVADCPQLATVGKGEHQLPINVEVVELFLCPNLASLPNDLSNLTSLRELIVKNCPRLTCFPANGIPPILKRLEILSCNDLESLPSNISTLERLEIKDCLSLRIWSMANFPADLKKLSIKNCPQLEAVTDLMFPQDMKVSLEELSLCNWVNFRNLLQRLNAFSSLVELNLSSCKGLREFPERGLPPRIRALSIEDCGSLKSLPARMRSMKSLLSLEIRSCPKLESFPNCDLPQNLSSLRIWDSKKFKPLAEWGLHRLTSLREFSICGGFKELQLLGAGVDLFPSSLTKFSIARFPNLNSLAMVLENLNLLRHLQIMNCAKLNDLPSEQLLGRLLHLEISECTLLSLKCVKGRGDYWSKISGIPCVEIDGTYIYK